MSDNSLACQLPGCEGTPPILDGAGARRHRHRYHAMPVPFDFEGCQYIVTHSNNGYTCPFPECGKQLKQRDGIENHVVVDHGVDVDKKLFTTTPTGLRGAKDHDRNNAVAQEPGPAAHFPRGDGSKVHLVASTDYLKSNAIMDAVGVCMHTELKILLCYPCGVALTSNMVASHRKNVPSADLQALLNFCSESNLYVKQEQVKLPAPGGPPVQLIAKPSEGLACRASADCTYCVKDLQTMQRHCREKHGTDRLTEIKYRPCLVQRIFTGVCNSYFEIDGNLALGVVSDLRAALDTTFLPALDVPLVVPADTERERTPLVRCMGWDKFMPDIRMNPVQRQAADQIKKKHSAEEHGGLLSRLAVAIKDHMAKASTILDGHPHKLTLSKVLLYGDAIPREQDNHWKPVSDDNTEYPNFMIQLMRNIVRIHLGFPLNFSFALSAVQTKCLEDLVTVLQEDTSTPRRRMIAYHELAWSLVDTDPELCVTDRWANPIQRAVWLRALRADGNFSEPSNITPDLAKFKYLCNATSLLEALMDKDKDADFVHADDYERVARIHQRVLRLGPPTTFNFIYEMQQYASSLAFNQKKEPNVYVDPEVQSITIGTETMRMEKLREGIQGLLRDFKLRYAALTNDNVMLTHMPDNIKDDHANTTRGYSFMSEELFHKKRHSLFFFLVECYGLAMVDNSGRISWNIPGIKTLLRRTSRVWEPLYHLLYITTHISCRGTQFIDHQVRNADRHRNLFIGGKEMFILTGYSKKTGITDRDSCTPG
ncbi:hypothetical protein BDR05DRAFT_954064, partial [Suillus weaverae]